ncbi:hypothetical protein QZH41_015853 [Actinostola sp. cb2023]|nr:hypothetical protein QZH41_015853 [Actinostola sp. cb2023]
MPYCFLKSLGFGREYQVESREYQVKSREYQVESREYQVESREYQVESREYQVESREYQVESREYQVESREYQVESREYQVIRSRLLKSKAAGHAIWNSHPGAIVTSPFYSRDLQDFPFYHVKQGMKKALFTAVIYATSTGIKESSLLYRLIQQVAESKSAAKILVLWMSDSAIPENKRWPPVRVPLMIVRPDIKTPNSRFIPRSIIETDAILSLNGDVKLNVDEVDFAFNVWKDFPQRIVGFQSRNCYEQRHNGKTHWMYSSVQSNDFSMVLTTNAFYHSSSTFLFDSIIKTKFSETAVYSSKYVTGDMLISHSPS